MEEDWIIDKEGAKIREKIIIPFIDDLWERVSNEYSNGGDRYPLVKNFFADVKYALDGSGREKLIKKMLKCMCGELYLNKEGKTKNGKFLTYIEPEEKEEKMEEPVDSDKVTHTKNKKCSPKKKSKETCSSPKKPPESPKKTVDYHSTDSSSCSSDSEQCDRKYPEICKRWDKAKEERGIKKEIVIIEPKKKKGKIV